MGRIIIKAARYAAIGFFLFLISCPNPLEDKLTETIETEVQIATADQYKLTVETPENGIINPSGSITVKDSISQQILASPYQTHAFIRWEKVSGSGSVVFESPESAETSFFVTGGSAVIRAVLEERPYVKYSTPSGTDISRNAKVLVKFSKDMVASLFNSTTVKIIKESDESQVQGSLSYLNQVLTFIPDNIWEKYTRYSIQVSKDVTDEMGINLKENYISPTTFMTGSSEDSTPPDSCLFYINGNTTATPEWTNTRTVNLTGIDGDDPNDGSGLAFIYVSNDNADGNSFNQYEFTNTIQWELTEGDELKTVYMDFEDACYNSLAGVSGGGTPSIYDNTQLISKTIYLDTTAPVSAATSEVPAETGVAVYGTPNNASNTYTNQTTLDLSIAAEDGGVDNGAASQMEMFISSDLSGTEGEWDPDNSVHLTPSWESYSTTKTWEIEPVEGNSYIIIKFRDSLGNESGKTFDYIKYDISAPEGSINIENSSLYTNTSAVTLYLDTSDTGVDYNLKTQSEMFISNDSAGTQGQWNGSSYDSPAWESFSSTKIWNFEPTESLKTIYVKFRDSLQNTMTDPESAAITYDNTIPVGSVLTINNGDAETGSTTVNLTAISASDSGGAGLSEMAFNFEDDNTDAEWIPYSTSGTYSPPAGEWNNGDSMYVYAWFRDNAGNISSSIYDTISLNTTPPDGSFVIDHDAIYTNNTSRLVSINMNLTDDSSYYRIANTTSELSAAAWTAYGSTDQKTETNWQLTSGEGTKTVYVQFKSGLDIEGPVMSDTIILDITAPVVGNCYLGGTADDNSATNQSYVTINSSVSGSPVYMRFKNESSGTWSSWYSYSTTKTNWYLYNYTVDGTKTVYFEYMDAAGNTTGGTHYDTIILDKTAPSVTYFRIAGTDNPAKTNQTSVTLYSSVTDAGSGVYQMNIGNYLDPWNGWETYSSARTGWAIKNPTVDEEKRIYCYYKDKAGNTTSTSLYDTIVLDTVAPTNVSILINNDRKYAYDQNVTLTINTDDTSTAGYQMKFRYIVGSVYIWTAYEPYSTSKTITLSDSDATKYVYVQVMDDAGNESGLYDHRDTIILDRPSISYVTKGRPGSKGYVNVYLNTVLEDTTAGEDVRYRIYASTDPDDSAPLYRTYIYNSGDQVLAPAEETDYYYFVRIGHYYDGVWHNLNTYFNGTGGSDKSGYTADVVIIYNSADSADLTFANNVKTILQTDYPTVYSSTITGTQPDWSVKVIPDTDIPDTYSAENIIYGKPAIITPGLYHTYTDSAKDGWVRNIAEGNQGIITMGSAAWVLDRIEVNHTSWGLAGQSPTDVGFGESGSFTDSSTSTIMDIAKVGTLNTIWRSPLTSSTIGSSPTSGSGFTLFSTKVTDSSGIAVSRPSGANPEGDGYNYAQINSTSYYYPIVRQYRYMFWGWGTSLPYYTNGKILLINTVALMDYY